ncbi:hypothetical protein PMI16_04836 [Herbaspirillum sp. CF444]|uniref:hypothetical protein n=1 Tax=Herbaspirillum sp. CF444 TaxID=1144319 RepID=UPI00027246A0|nr:hypothetical protein [Herbaspirillum sp. CF444]EJL81230.1 hypothetical protein PMI16_04836 [Herbaspirillum sp. CF444]
MSIDKATERLMALRDKGLATRQDPEEIKRRSKKTRGVTAAEWAEIAEKSRDPNLRKGQGKTAFPHIRIEE